MDQLLCKFTKARKWKMFGAPHKKMYFDYWCDTHQRWRTKDCDEVVE